MKKVAIVAVIVGMAMAAQADYFVNISSSFGIYDATVSTGILPINPSTGLIQLIYAGADGIANESTPGTLDMSLGGSLTAGDDVFLGQLTFSNNGGLFEDFAAGNYGNIQSAFLATGDVYARIFNDDVLSQGDSYYIGHVQVVPNKDFGGLPPSPTLYDLGQGNDLQAATGVVTAIPEPATFGLMGIAGLGMFLARKKARR